MDLEKLERLRQPLQEHGIDPDRLPEPETPEWDDVVRKLSEQDLPLAQEFYTLAYDPEDQASAELIEAQAKRAASRGGPLGRLKPLTNTRTVNGDVVPNNKLYRNVALGVGAALLLGLYLLQPPKPKIVARKPAPTDTSTAATSTDSSDIPAAPKKTQKTKENAGALDTLLTGKTSSTAAGSTNAQATPNTSPATDTATPTTLHAVTQEPETASPSQVETPTSAPVPETTTTVPTWSSASPTVSRRQSETPSSVVSPGSRATWTVPALTPLQRSESTVTLKAAPHPVVLSQGLPKHVVTAIKKVSHGGPIALVAGTQQTERAAGQAQMTLHQVGLRTTSEQMSGTESKTSGAGGSELAQGSPHLNVTQTAATGQTSGTTPGAAQPGLYATSASVGGQAATPARTYGLMLTQASTEETGKAGENATAGQGNEHTDTKPYGIFMASVATGTTQTATPNNTPGTLENPAPATAPQNPYVMGQSLHAKLMTGAGVVEGAQDQVHVFAQGEDGSIWRGVPSLDGRQRMQITFDAVLKDGQQYDVNANAYAANDNMAALPAKVSTSTPNLAFNLFNGLAKGAQTFAQAMINQKTVSYQQSLVTGMSSTTSTNAIPNFWLTTGAALLGSLAMPESKSSTVMVAQLPVGTVFNIVVNGSGMK